jgi:transposase
MSTLLQMVVPDAPQNLIGDNAYDSDRLDAELRFYGIELIAPHRRNRRNSTKDGRRLKRYRRRWKIERLFAWLQYFQRVWSLDMNIPPKTFSGCSNLPRL